MPVLDSSIQSLIHAVEQADSPARLLAAVKQLAMARSTDAISTLIQILGYNNPGAAVIAVEGLTQLGADAVQPLLEQLDDYNYGARAWAIRALVGIGDPRSLEVLLAAAIADFAPSVRRAAAKGIGTIQWDLLPPFQKTDQTAAQARALEALLQVTEDADWSIRYAAIVGLQGLAAALPPDLLTAAIARLQALSEADPDLAVLGRARYAIATLMSRTP